MLEANKFNEKDSKNLVNFLNIIAEEGDFNLKVKEVIEFYGLLAWAQQELRRKIEANTLEVKAIHEPEPEPKPEPKRRAKKG